MKKLTFFKRFEIGLILFTILLRFMEKKGYIFYFCRYIPYPNIIYWLLLIIILLALFYILPKSKAKIRYYVLILFLTPCSFIYVWFSFRLAEGPVITMKNSPDEVHQIFFVEYLSEHLDPKVYERINFFILKEIGEPYIIDRTYPIRDGEFVIDWNSSGFTLKNADPNSFNKYECLSVHYATNKDGELINQQPIEDGGD